MNGWETNASDQPGSMRKRPAIATLSVQNWLGPEAGARSREWTCAPSASNDRSLPFGKNAAPSAKV